MNVGTPNTNGDLTFLDRPTTANPGGNPDNLIKIADNLADSSDTLFSVLSMDSGRNLFAVWAISDSTSAQTQPAQRHSPAPAHPAPPYHASKTDCLIARPEQGREEPPPSYYRSPPPHSHRNTHPVPTRELTLKVAMKPMDRTLYLIG